MYAGREIARALALGSTAEADCTANLDDLTKEQLAKLDEQEARFQSTYDKVGEVSSAAQATSSKQLELILDAQ